MSFNLKKFEEASLKDWFNKEKWVDVSRKKEDGGYEECGRSDADKGSYPVCVPKSKAKTLDEKERKNRIRAKRKNEKKKRKGKSPNRTEYTKEQGGKSKTSSFNLTKLLNREQTPQKMTFKECLHKFSDHFVDFSGDWDFDSLVTAGVVLQVLPDEILEKEITLDNKHIVINMDNGSQEVLNLIPTNLVETTKEKKEND